MTWDTSKKNSVRVFWKQDKESGKVVREEKFWRKIVIFE
jgi:hypothetical protein